MKKIISLFTLILCLHIAFPSLSAPDTPKKVVLIGATGEGKSSLINSFYREKLNTDKSLVSVDGQPLISTRIYTQVRIRAYPLLYINKRRTITDSDTARITEYQFKDNITFVDTPGLDDTHGPEVQHKILRALQDYLAENAETIDSLVLVINGAERYNRPSFKRIWDSLQQLLPVSLATSLDVVINFSDFSPDEQSRVCQRILDGAGILPRTLYQVNLRYLTQGDKARGKEETLLELQRFSDDLAQLSHPLNLREDVDYTQWLRQQLPHIFEITKQVADSEQLTSKMQRLREALTQAEAFAATLKANPNHKVPSLSTQDVELHKTKLEAGTQTLEIPVVTQKIAYREKTVRVKTLWSRIKSVLNKVKYFPVLNEFCQYIAPLEPMLDKAFATDPKSSTYQEPYLVNAESTQSVTVSAVRVEPYTKTETQTHIELNDTENPMATYHLQRQHEILDACWQELEEIEQQLNSLDQSFNTVKTDFQQSLNTLSKTPDLFLEEKITRMFNVLLESYPNYFNNDTKRQHAHAVIKHFLSEQA